MKESKVDFVFHVVNSVKGGCGKSTISLLLAEYWRSKGNPVYIIDLDTDGTSWLNDYIGCYKEKDNTVYINDVVYNSNIIHYLSPWMEIDSKILFNYSSTNFKCSDNSIKVCLANPQKRMNQIGYETDLFEQAVESLLKDIINKTEVGNTVHVIFDMAPGYDEKSELLLKHWLLTNRFFVYKDNIKSDKFNYSIRLYMISTLLPSSITANAQYVQELLTVPKDFGSIIQDKINNIDNKNSMEIRFIYNDINNNYSNYYTLNDNKIKNLWEKTNTNCFNNKLKDMNRIYFILFPYKKMPHKSKQLEEIGIIINDTSETHPFVLIDNQCCYGKYDLKLYDALFGDMT